MARIYLVEWPTDARMARLALEISGHSVHWIMSGSQAVRTWSNEKYDILAMNFHTSDLTAREMLTSLQARGKSPQVAVVYIEVEMLFSIDPKGIKEDLQALMPEGKLAVFLKPPGNFYVTLVDAVRVLCTPTQEQEA